ncbi:endonuclease MutS2 [Lactobacillus amylovorus]|uniref:endonuclease MutS2 n=1 Tax=Lactobacillus amylovorus TaxID=1604 RepID=UPI001476519A|nr:endonuclease MutS2 [Lactobacillus amylovorus]MCI7161446.1 endonuclease MutS2 [Lactobacillus amylovorus]MCT3599536.1 endonuclease MutS2 [Lactobacillus amylovorus]MDD7408003.1 endonuclease MutS2 [Lactobacillus amylovorus]MDY5960345.1 endonuclease MutS2 [Lactobacillus amylovorus]NME30523.1 endonuclease MutS2 [Lactobacillus amylovorus]
MNKKILKILEFGEITKRLSELAITEPAKKEAERLVPSDDFDQVQTELKQTLALADLLRIKGQLPLTDFKDVRPSTKRLGVKANLNAKELGNLLLVLNLANEINSFLEDLDDEKIDLSAIDSILDQLDVPDLLFRELKKSLDYDGEVLDTASSALARLRHDIASNEEEIKDKMNAYTKGNSSKYLSEQIVTIRDDRYVIPVKQEYRTKFGGVVHDQSASGQTLFIEPEAVLNLNNRQQNLIAQEKQEIRNILKHLSGLAREEIDSLNNIATALTRLDFLQAKAKLAKNMKASEPILTKDHSINLRNARHPLIDPEKVVPNDIRLGDDFDTMLITGPNTGGKTITLKTAGLLQLMAQSGLFIPAEEGSKVGVFEEVYADIGDEQSIEQSLSTFSSHINDIVAIMKNVNKETLVLIDEIGAGTDPEEGASLAISILDFLRQKDAKIMVTTHYPELKLYGYNRPRTTNASMEFDLKTLSPTYHLQIGIPGHSNAFAIARRLGMREDVVKNAQNLMSDEDSDINKMISKLDAQTKAATSARNRLETSLDRSQKLEQKLQQALDWYNQRVQKQLDFAQERANEIIAKRRKKADQIIEQLEKQKNAGVKENKIIEAKGELNNLERQANNLAHNKVLQREKRRHHVNVGDRVKVLSYGQTGTITKKLSEHEYEVQMGIIKVKASDRDIERIEKNESTKPKHLVRATSAVRRSNAHSELDLRGQRYDEAMTNLDRYIDSVLLAGLGTVTIIHGIGTGAIRKGVWQYLRNSRHVKSFNYAPANEGGNGATIVELK